MKTIDLYLFVCKIVFASNRIICFDRRIEAKSLRYITYAYYRDKLAAHMAAIAADMIYEMRF